MVKTVASPKPPLSFEDALKELESVVRAMEGGELPLEASLDAYKRGAELLRFCQERLSAAEQQLKILDGDQLRDLSADPDDIA